MKNIRINTFIGLLIGFVWTTSVNAQVAQQKVGGNPMTINQNAALEIESADRGLLLPRLELKATDNFEPLAAHVEGMTVYNTAMAGTDDKAVTPGYYYNDGTQWVRIVNSTDIPTEPWFDQTTNTEATDNTQNIYQMGRVGIGETAPTNALHVKSTANPVRLEGLETGAATDKIVVANKDGVLKTLKAAMPKFFYMPSIIIPTSNEQLQADGSGALTADSFDDSTRQGSISLYGRYEVQFGTPMESNVGATTQLPVLPATELDYHITWYDNTVFTSVSVSDTGVMSYTVAADADITIGSFMNIVFAVKED